MERDHEDMPGYRRLPGPEAPYPDDPPSARRAGLPRDDGVRAVRRASNWTAAALIAGVAATAGYFAHASPPAAPATGATVGTTPAGTAAHHHKACPAAPVATSGGSGVTAAMPASGSCAAGAGPSRTAAPAWTGGDD